MLKGASFIDDWMAEGEARGEARGRTVEVRKIVHHVLPTRFRELPERVAQVADADAEWCRVVTRRALEAGSLEELGL